MIAYYYDREQQGGQGYGRGRERRDKEKGERGEQGEWEERVEERKRQSGPRQKAERGIMSVPGS